MSSTPPAGPPSPGLKIASVRGVPIYIARTWVFIAVLIVATFGPQIASVRPEWGIGAYALAAVYTLLLLLSVIVHELAHTLAALSRGYRVERIVADLWGGHTSYDAGETTPGHLAFISVVGPLANLALAGIGFLAMQQLDLPEAPELLLWAFTWGNAFVGVFNALPGLPLDGGFLVDALVWKITGNRASGMRAAGWSGRVVAVLVVAWALWSFSQHERSMFSLIWMALIASFLWRGASAAVAVGGNRQVLSAMRLSDLIRPAITVDQNTVITQGPATAEALIVTDASGAPVGIVPPGAHVRVPIDQRAQVPLAALAHALPPEAIVRLHHPDADITEVLPAFATNPPQPLVVLVDAFHDATNTTRTRVVGVVTYTDVEHALQQQAHRLHSSP